MSHLNYSDKFWFLIITVNGIIKKYSSEKVTEMCFPDENYDYDAMKESTFIGAYDGKNCIGLAILQPGFFKYMYLSDLKVNKNYRDQHVGKS